MPPVCRLKSGAALRKSEGTLGKLGASLAHKKRLPNFVPSLGTRNNSDLVTAYQGHTDGIPYITSVPPITWSSTAYYTKSGTGGTPFQTFSNCFLDIEIIRPNLLSKEYAPLVIIWQVSADDRDYMPRKNNLSFAAVSIPRFGN